MEGDDNTSVNGGFTGGQKGQIHISDQIQWVDIENNEYNAKVYDTSQATWKAFLKDLTPQTLFVVAVMLSCQVIMRTCLRCLISWLGNDDKTSENHDFDDVSQYVWTSLPVTTCVQLDVN